MRWLNGQNETAIALAKTLRPEDRASTLALIYAAMGRFGEAADALMELTGGDPNSGLVQTARLLRMGHTMTTSPEELARLRRYDEMLFLYLGARPSGSRR